MTLTRHIILVARRPRYGQGKRRLAKETGELIAWRFQRQALHDLLQRLSDPRWRLWLALTPDREALYRWPGLRRSVKSLGQGGGDLGQRLGRLLAWPPPGPVLLIGSDCPQIEKADLAQAFRWLGRRRWVVGPAEDGGFWLLGARRRPRLRLPFAGVRWSHPETLSDLLAKLEEQPAYLHSLGDVDRREDLERLKSRRRRQGPPLP